MWNTSSSTPVVSPCVNICELDADQLCIGCGRSLAEIAEWSAASNPRRQQICDQAQQRMTVLLAATTAKKTFKAR